MEQVLKLLDKKSNFSEIINSNTKNKINNFQKIELKNIYFKYPKDDKLILKNLNLTIHKGDKIGIIGSTGCGKSTLLNILMGLIKPNEGELLIDNKNINNNIYELLSWYLSISHVPQSIYLSDKSFIENIAFGINKNDIKINNAKKAAKDCEISGFIETRKEKYFSLVGEQGKNLSNGQKQRIGIARAFYKKSKLLILDEATSALDNKTENKIMNNIDLVKSNLTIIMVAHRLSSLKYCDRIIEINNGQIIKESTPQDLNII